VATKAELRRTLEEKRQALTRDEVEAASRAVLEQLQRVVDWPAVKSIHVYSSVEEWGELDTSHLVDWLQDEWPDIEVVQPSLLKDQPFPEQLFDVIVVPALGFDRDNNRVGFGGGWYDRFVAQQLQAQKIGVAYAWALVEDGIPVDPWDMKLDLVVSA
jgi:5-formyltetrahydrofolate cyclo-ligase